nr:hypothetical protein CFP56_31720 [Quercus suber]
MTATRPLPLTRHAQQRALSGSTQEEQRPMVAKTTPESRWFEAMGKRPPCEAYALPIRRSHGRNYFWLPVHDDSHGSWQEDLVLDQE